MDIELPSLSSDVPSELPLLRKQAPPTTCGICLGKATGYHYDVASCDGCKTFFRRVTVDNHNYLCKLDDKCFTDLKIGDPMPKCRGCRFKKCVEVGMNYRKVQCVAGGTKVIEKPLQTIDLQVGELIDKMMRLHVQSEKFRDCAYNPDSYPSLKDSLRVENSMLSIANKYEVSREVQKDLACKTIHHQQNQNNFFSKKWVLYELLTQVELAKALPFYSDLSHSDRFSLARDTLMMSTHFTRAFFSFEQKSDKLLRLDRVGFYDYPFEFYDEYRARFRDDIGMRCLRPILRNGLDRVEFVLLRVLVLTTPGVPDISETARKYLTKERRKYSNALFRYILTKHGQSGPERFVNIIGLLGVLENQQRDHRDLNTFLNAIKLRNVTEPIVNEVMRH